MRTQTKIGVHVKRPIFVSTFKQTAQHINRVQYWCQILNFLKIYSLFLDFWHASRQLTQYSY